MSVIGVHLLWEGESGTADETGLREYKQVWQVITDDPADNVVVVGADPRLPARFAPYPGDPTSYVRRLAPKRTAEPVIWHVDVDYSNRIPEEQENPLDKPPDVQWDSSEILRPIIKDRHGNAILNKAGTYFDPPPEDDDATTIATITMNLANVPTWILEYRKAINQDSFTLENIQIEAGTAKIQRLSVGPWQEENDVAFRVVTIVIEINEDGWALELLEQGFYELDDDGEVQLIKISGQPCTAPQMLDANGKRIVDPTPETAIFTKFDVKKELPFSNLNLPS